MSSTKSYRFSFFIELVINKNISDISHIPLLLRKQISNLCSSMHLKFYYVNDPTIFLLCWIQAISVKQNMLIEHALHPGMSNGKESNDNIRVFSSKVGDEADETTSSPAKSSEKAFDLQHVVHSGMTGQLEQSELQTSDSFSFSSDLESPNSITNHSSYDAFLDHIGFQLDSLECEIEQYISSQLAEQVDIQKPINAKWQKLSDVLKLVTETRER